MRNFQLELLYENARGETYAMQIGSGFFIGLAAVILVVVAVSAAFLASAIFSSRRIKKTEKVMRQKEALCFQPVQEYHSSPSVIPAVTKTGIPGMVGEGEKDSSGETTVLGGAWIPPVGTLWRRKTGERIRIRKSSFSIGQDCREVDYSIPDNLLISRVHTVLRCQYGFYYIADKDSVNGTFVNEKRLALGQEVCLKSGDRIRIADEEFEFYM